MPWLPRGVALSQSWSSGQNLSPASGPPGPQWYRDSYSGKGLHLYPPVWFLQLPPSDTGSLLSGKLKLLGTKMICYLQDTGRELKELGSPSPSGLRILELLGLGRGIDVWCCWRAGEATGGIKLVKKWGHRGGHWPQSQV
jgi:hypothetical protein